MKGAALSTGGRVEGRDEDPAFGEFSLLWILLCISLSFNWLHGQFDNQEPS